MKLLLSVIVGLLIAWIILSFVDRETYVLAPVTYERSKVLDPDEEERRLIKALASASGRNVSDQDARQILSTVDAARAPAPVMVLPGAPPPAAFALPQPGPTAPAGMTADARAAQTAAAAAAAAADLPGAARADGTGTGVGFGAGGVGLTTVTAGGAPIIMGGRPTQPVVAGVAALAPAPVSRAMAMAPAPAPAAVIYGGRAPAPAPATRGAKTRREILIEEIDEILKKI